MQLRGAFVFFAMMLVQMGCSDRNACSFDVNRDYLKSNCSLVNGVQIRKLSDVVLNQFGFPKEYQIVSRASYAAKSQDDFSRVYRKGLMKIYFKQKMDGYRWIFHDAGTISDTLPFNFEINRWYLIDRLYEGGAPTVQLFVYVNNDGHFTTARSDSKTNM